MCVCVCVYLFMYIVMLFQIHILNLEPRNEIF